MHDDDLKTLCAATFAQVEKMFDREVRQALLREFHLAQAPVIGTLFNATDEAAIAKLKHQVCRVPGACEWHRRHAPSWAQPLPVSCSELYDRRLADFSPKRKLLLHFGNSLRVLEWHYNQHPPFPTYAAGVLAHDFAPDELRNDSELVKEFPPRPLAGIDRFLRYNTPALIAHRRHELMHMLLDRRKNGASPLVDDAINSCARELAMISTDLA